MNPPLKALSRIITGDESWVLHLQPRSFHFHCPVPMPSPSGLVISRFDFFFFFLLPWHSWGLLPMTHPSGSDCQTCTETSWGVSDMTFGENNLSCALLAWKENKNRICLFFFLNLQYFIVLTLHIPPKWNSNLRAGALTHWRRYSVHLSRVQGGKPGLKIKAALKAVQRNTKSRCWKGAILNFNPVWYSFF